MIRKKIIKYIALSNFILVGIVFGKVLFTHQERIIDIEISQTGQMITSVSKDGHVIVWDQLNDKSVYEIKIDSTKIVSTITLSTDNQLLAIGFNNGNIDVIDINENIFFTLDNSSNNMISLLQFINNNTLLSYINGEVINVSNLNLGLEDIYSSIDLGNLIMPEAQILGMKINSNHRNILGITNTNNFFRWDIEKVKIQKSTASFSALLKDKNKQNSSFNQLQKGYDFGRLKSISQPTKNWWSNETYNYYDFDISPDGSRIAAVTTDNTVIVWNANFNEKDKFIDGHDYRLNSIKFSSDGRFLATSSIDKLLKVWDVNSGELIKKFEIIDDWITVITFTSDIIICGTFRGEIIKFNL